MEPVTLFRPKVQDYLSCLSPGCGNPWPNRLGKCCGVKCRVALHRWRTRISVAGVTVSASAQPPTVRIGKHHNTKTTLNSDTYGLEGRTLKTSAVLTTSERTPANVKEWATKIHRPRHKK